MKFIPFKSVGDFYFKFSIKEVQKLLINTQYVLGSKEELGKKYMSIFIPKDKIFIVFNELGTFIRTIEIENDVFFEKCNLFKEPLDSIKFFLNSKDDFCIVSEEGILESKKNGLVISKENNRGNIIMFFSREYLNEDDISPDDIIKYYLG